MVRGKELASARLSPSARPRRPNSLLQFNFALAAPCGFPHVPAHRPRIGPRALSAHGELPRVAGAAIRLQFLEPLDVLADKLSQFSLDAAILLYPARSEEHTSE